MNLLAQFDFWLIAVGGVLLLRQLFTALAADQGRKQDLVKKFYKPSQDFQISVLVPFLEASQEQDLLRLLGALGDQEYPASKVALHIVTDETTYPALEALQLADTLAPNVRVWTYPQANVHYESAIGWLIDRCLAFGGTGMFVFLKPSDMVKADFFQNIVARGFDSFIIQGYIANKMMPDNPLERVLALSRRMANRISNAGRYHLGLSCRLMDSGWAIKQDVLEMIPFQRGRDFDNLEYTLRLNLENFRVSWAPSVVVYSGREDDWVSMVTQSVATIVNRARMSLQYGPRLVVRAITRMDLTYLENALSIVRPPTVLISAGLVFVGLLSVMLPEGLWSLGKPVTWFALALCVQVVQLCGLAVARGKGTDYFTMLVLMPLVYLLGILALPIGFIQYVSSLTHDKEHRKEDSLGYKRRSTRFDEREKPATAPALSMDYLDERKRDPFAPSRSAIDEILQEEYARMEQGEDGLGERNASLQARKALDSVFGKKNYRERENVDPDGYDQDEQGAEGFWGQMKRSLPLGMNGLPFQKNASKKGFNHPLGNSQSVEAAAMALNAMLPREQVKSITLSNGKNQIECLLKTLTVFDEQGEQYRLTLEYKSLSFSTSMYRILDQAFYELFTKLSAKGMTIITCGSCGYFYNPTADVPGMIRNTGVCLFGKTGKEVNLNTDAVSVLSQACDYHFPLEQREAIVQQWKDSLDQAHVF